MNYPTEPGITRLYGEEKPRYVVYKEGAKAPSKEHDSRIRARKEMERLARRHPDTPFHLAKIKESLVFRQDVKIGDTVKITKENSALLGQSGNVRAISEGGSYGVKFGESSKASFRRYDFIVVPEPVIPRAIGTRIWFKNLDGIPLTGTIIAVEPDIEMATAKLDLFPEGPTVRITFAEWQNVVPQAFISGQYVTIKDSHYRFGGATGYVADIDEDTVGVRFSYPDGLVRFHPGSLVVQNVVPAFAPGTYARVVLFGDVFEDRVGIVTLNHSDAVVGLRFQSGGDSYSYHVAGLRPALEDQFEEEPAAQPNIEHGPNHFGLGDLVRHANGSTKRRGWIKHTAPDGMHYDVRSEAGAIFAYGGHSRDLELIEKGEQDQPKYQTGEYVEFIDNDPDHNETYQVYFRIAEEEPFLENGEWCYTLRNPNTGKNLLGKVEEASLARIEITHQFERGDEVTINRGWRIGKKGQVTLVFTDNIMVTFADGNMVSYHPDDLVMSL